MVVRIFCDKCGREITEAEYDIAIVKDSEHEDSENFHYNLCGECGQVLLDHLQNETPQAEA